MLTSIGFDTDGLDMARVADVAVGTGAVRASMTAVPGLYCQRSFFFPRVLAHDVMTSFTRFTVLRSQGTWYGADPFAVH